MCCGDNFVDFCLQLTSFSHQCSPFCFELQLPYFPMFIVHWRVDSYFHFDIHLHAALTLHRVIFCYFLLFQFKTCQGVGQNVNNWSFNQVFVSLHWNVLLLKDLFYNLSWIYQVCHILNQTMNWCYSYFVRIKPHSTVTRRKQRILPLNIESLLRRWELISKLNQKTPPPNSIPHRTKVRVPILFVLYLSCWSQTIKRFSGG